MDTNLIRSSVVRTDGAPAPIGPYSQAVSAGQLVFCSGQIGLDPVTGILVAGGVAVETRRVLDNLTAVLAAAGLTLAHVVRTDIFLADMNDFSAVNEIYAEYFSSDPKPARQTVGVAALPKNATVEISCIAYIPLSQGRA
ncbi:MAG: RidA family protein [Patescibacteria group bacterium]|nr:RidA family protein [Patescibacteria group bacterium]